MKQLAKITKATIKMIQGLRENNLRKILPIFDISGSTINIILLYTKHLTVPKFAPKIH